MSPTQRFNLSYLTVAFLGVWILHGLMVQATSVAQLPYSEFKRLLEAGPLAHRGREFRFRCRRHDLNPVLVRAAYEGTATVRPSP